jgi:A/G-specific adenine glycosylase
VTESDRARAIAPPLLTWFDRHKRDLPWRHTSDPYRIWVSEVMLQQTQVDRVIDYYWRFLERFPTVEALAEAPLDDVLALWEGLGYYSRARNLQAAAQQIVAEHDGQFPGEPEAARKLPGVGEYTAGAVLSIAFDRPMPAVDANVIRVIARLFAVEGEVTTGPGRRRVSELAAAAVPDERVGDFNQALMELGALICIPGRPGCLVCPVTDICAARERGLQSEIPPPRSRSVRQVKAVAGAILDGDLVLLARRPPDGQWGGLWEFPNVRVADGDADAREVLVEHLQDAFGLEVELRDELASFSYGVMNRRVALTVLSGVRRAGRLHTTTHEEARWVELPELADFALPSPHRAMAEILSEKLT